MNRLIISFCLLVLSTSVFSVEPVWKQRTGPGDLRDIVYADGRFVVVDYANSAFRISVDGKEWEVFETTDDYGFTDITYGNGRFVAVNGRGEYGYSFDGVEWMRGSGSVASNDVTFGKGLFVAVGRDGTVSTSPDGETWAAGTTGVLEHLNGVIFADNEFVAVGSNMTMIRSSDAINWQVVAQDPSSALSLFSYYNIEYLQGRYYLNGGGNGDDFTAETITNWALIGADTGSVDSGAGMASNGSIFVNTGGQYSVDGLIWTGPSLGDNRAVAYGNGTFVIVGEGSQIYSSEDGINWEQQDGNKVQVLDRGAIIYAEGRFVYSRPGNSIHTSYDGLQNDHSVPVLGSNDSFRDILYDAGLYVAVTDDGAIYSSDDALVWTERLAEDDTRGFYAVASGGGRFVAVGTQGTVFTSSDGLNWSDAASAVVGTKTLTSVTFGSQGFVAVGYQGVLFTSPDGMAWTAASSGVTSSLTKVVYGHGKYVAVGDNGTHLSSADAVNWDNTDTGSKNFEDVTVTNTGFVAVGNVGTVSSSADGLSWDDVRIATTSNWFSKALSVDGVIFVYGASSSFTLGDFVPGDSAAVPPPLQVRDRRSGWGAYDIAFGNGRFVAVGGSGYSGSFGDGGPISMVSVDGKQWRMTYGIPYQADSILFQNGRFIAVSSDVVKNTTTFLYSLDGLTWTTGRIYDGVSRIATLEYYNGIFFGVGYPGVIIRSTDGDDWDVISSADDSSDSLKAVNYANGRYVASGGHQSIRVSDDDGITWTKHDTVQDNGDLTTSAINLDRVYTNGGFFFSDVTGHGASINGRHVSSDGVTWSLPTKFTLMDEDGVLTEELDSISGPNQYVRDKGLHVTYTGSGYVTTSSDGINWTRRQGDFGSAQRDRDGDDFGFNSKFHVAYGNNTYVIMSDDDSDRLLSTDNGLTWQRVAPLGGQGIRYLNGKLLRGMPFGSSLQISNNLGVTWSTIYDATNSDSRSDIVDLAYGNGVYVAVCHGSGADDPTLYSSPDALTWLDNGGLNQEPNSVVYANGLFVTVGDGGLILSSADGVNWDTQTSGTVENLEEVTWGHAGFVAVGQNNVILTSPDAVTWIAQSAPINDNFMAVGYRAGVYIIGSRGRILRSTDGITWTVQLYLGDSSGDTNSFESIAEGSLGFLASSTNYGTWRSTDAGHSWWKVSDEGVYRNELTQAAGRVFFSAAMDNQYDGIIAINDIPTTADTDADGYPDTTDNCPDDSNSDQADDDGDGLGNACDPYPDDAYNDQPPPDDSITIFLPDGEMVWDAIFYFDAEGFKPFTLVQAFIQSEPIFVGEAMSDKDGKVHFVITIPFELPLGDHSLILVGQNFDGSERRLTASIKVKLTEVMFMNDFE